MAKLKLVRKFKGKAVSMLSACETIVKHAINRKDYLIAERSSWKDPFFEDLLKRISAAFVDHLGICGSSELREATQKVLSKQAAVLNDLSIFYVQVKEDFKSDKPRLQNILTDLGFTGLYKNVTRKDQEDMIQLLYQFTDNMKPELKADIIAKGMSENRIDGIITHALEFRELNVSQELLKGSRKEITQAAVNEFNDIYEEVSSIAKIATKMYKNDKAAQELFSYTKLMKNLGH